MSPELAELAGKTVLAALLGGLVGAEGGGSGPAVPAEPTSATSAASGSRAAPAIATPAAGSAAPANPATPATAAPARVAVVVLPAVRPYALLAAGLALLTDAAFGLGQGGEAPGAGTDLARAGSAWLAGGVAGRAVLGMLLLAAAVIVPARGAAPGRPAGAGLWATTVLGLAVGASFYVEAAVAAVALVLFFSLLRGFRSVGGPGRGAP